MVASAEAKSLEKQKKDSKALFLASYKKPVSCGRFRPPAGGRGTFPHGKVPKGCRGQPKGAWNMAASGPPVAKLQCTASLAGARPAGFTSVPGRATVAFKVGFHFVKAKSLRDPRIRLWRKRGLAQLIPPPAPWRRSIPGVMARNCCGRNTLQRYMPRQLGHANGTRLVAGPGPNQMACPIRALSVEIQEEVPLPAQGGRRSPPQKKSP